MPFNKYPTVGQLLIRSLQVGDILVYLARPEDRPVDPNREYHGKVLRVCVDELCMYDHVRIESLEPGEEGLTEIVHPQQMLRKERAQPEENAPAS